MQKLPSKTPLMIAGILLGSTAAIGGLYYVVQIQFVNNLETRAAVALEGGDYLASLNSYEELKKTAPKRAEENNVEEKITEAKNLLVAEEILKKARKAAENGDWFEVKALLQSGDVTTNTSFTEYKEAIGLYVEAANNVKELEKKIEAELSQLKEETLAEQSKRQEVEKKVTEVEGKLESTIAESQKNEEKFQQEIRQSEAAKTAAEQDAENERTQKFLNEIALYVDMLGSGTGQLTDALTEIDEGKDATALTLLNQGRVFFDEVLMRSEELLANRTEEKFKNEVQKLLQATALLSDSSKNIGNAAFNIDQKESDTFKNALKTGREEINTARVLLKELQEFIASLR